MDPWYPFSGSGSSCILSTFPSSKSQELSFEDNFKPLVSDTLPDSKEYLATLEKKLNKLKSDENLLKQLHEKREACLQQLLSGLSDCSVVDNLEEPIANSAILRAIVPEKQALTQGELVELVKYDQLVNEDAANK